MFPVRIDGLVNSQEFVCDQKINNDRNLGISFPHNRG